MPIAPEIKQQIKELLEKELPDFLVAQKKAIIYERGGERNWPELSQKTIDKKGSDQPWIETGATINALSASYEDNGDTLAFGIAEQDLPEYAHYVDQGVEGGTDGIKAPIPARPLLNYTNQDMVEITAAVTELLQKNLGKK